MSTTNQAIAFALKNSQGMVKRFVADLTPQEFLHRPTPKANCAAWLIGHLTLTERSALRRFGAPLPELPEGFEHRFSRDEGCPQASEFGDVTNLVALFDEHRNRLVAAVGSASTEQLDKPLEKPHPLFGNIGEAMLFMAVHTAMHAGQISTIRRSLGRPPVI